MTPPPCTHNKNLNWKQHDDDDDIDELQAAMILTCLVSTIPSAASTSYDINIDTTTTDDDTTITVFHPVSPTSSITSSSPMMSISSSTAFSTKKHDRSIITPMLKSSPTELIEVTRPAKKIRRHKVDRSSSRRSRTAKPCVFPTVNDPEDISFEKTLHSDEDKGKINSAHVHIRREVLEVKRTMSGRVYFQCGWCKHLDRKNRVKSSIIAPQNIGCIYRAFGRFMKDHVPKCMHIPTDLRLLDAKKTDIVRGSKEYWISSANDIGLRDGVDGDGIIYCSPVHTGTAPVSIPNQELAYLVCG